MTEAAIDKLKLEADDSLPLRDVVFHTLRDAILEGALPPGTRLMELQLSSVLGVSRTPVREAMRLLSMEGLVRMSVRRGTIVEPIKESDLRDALEVREALEELAVRKACRNMDELTIQTLRKLEQEFELSLEKNDMQTSARLDVQFHERITEAAQTSARLDVQFHERITEAAHNRRLTQSLTQLREELYRYRLENLKDPETYPILVQAHRNIISALETHDEDRAAQELQRHIESQGTHPVASLTIFSHHAMMREMYEDSYMISLLELESHIDNSGRERIWQPKLQLSEQAP